MYDKEMIRLITQPSKTLHTRLEVLNMNDIIIDSLDGDCIDGSVSIDNSNMIRRTLNMTFVASPKLEISNKSPLWINKRIRVFIGIEKYNGEIVWFNLGIYCISNPETSISNSGRTITIKGVDKMVLFDNHLMFDTAINYDIPIHEVIKMLATLVGETKLLIEQSEYKTPYKIEASPDASVEEILKEVTNLYMNYQTYYNVDGYLVFEKMKNRVGDTPIWEFNQRYGVTVSRGIESRFDDVKNRIKVIGYMDSKTGIQPKYEMSITDSTHDFSISNIGERRICITEDNYTNEEQCKARCEYEMDNVKNLVRNISISTAPVYLLNDVNRVITICDNDEVYTCLIDKLDIPLSPSGLMSVQCHQIFN